jgi:hypothetical protein
MKKLLAVAVLAVSSFTIASAKSHDIVLSNQTKAGAIQLKPGQYSVKLEGSTAVFTDQNSGKKFVTPVKVETSDQKFDQTRVETTQAGSMDVVQEIDLGGSHTKVEFAGL